MKGLPRCAGGRALLAVLIISGATASAEARGRAAEADAKPFFYATVEACAAGKVFSRGECDAAFGNALAAIRARRLFFASRIDCLLEFRLCERQDGVGGFVPALLGVELVRDRGGGAATPVLAVPTPRGLLPPQPIAGRAEPALREREPLAIVRRTVVALPTDHFEPVDPSGVRDAWTHFLPRETPAPEPTFFESEPDKPRESPQARRQRLESAPFVE